MFGYMIIKKEDFDRIYKLASRQIQFGHYYYWFSGFEPLYNLLLKFAKGEVNQSNIWEVRDAYAKAMDTDRYGRSNVEAELAAEKRKNQLLEDANVQLRFNQIQLKAEHSKLKASYDEIISYLPKVPTEPYEKKLAKENRLLKVQLRNLLKKKKR